MWALEYCKCVTGYQTYRCDISKHLSLKSFLDMSTVSLFLLHYVFPVRVWHNKASLQHRQLSWRSLNREREREKKEWELHIIMTGHMTGEDEGLRVRWHVRQTGEELEDLTVPTAHTHLKVKPWTSSPRPQLCAASLHPFLRVWHRPTSSMRWRAAGIMSFSFPKKKRKKKTLWKGVLEMQHK